MRLWAHTRLGMRAFLPIRFRALRWALSINAAAAATRSRRVSSRAGRDLIAAVAGASGERTDGMRA
eukprot:356013-Chlamydomonas_euryale.AAC.2